MCKTTMDTTLKEHTVQCNFKRSLERSELRKGQVHVPAPEPWNPGAWDPGL